MSSTTQHVLLVVYLLLVGCKARQLGSMAEVPRAPAVTSPSQGFASARAGSKTSLEPAARDARRTTGSLRVRGLPEGTVKLPGWSAVLKVHEGLGGDPPRGELSFAADGWSRDGPIRCGFALNLGDISQGLQVDGVYDLTMPESPPRVGSVTVAPNQFSLRFLDKDWFLSRAGKATVEYAAGKLKGMLTATLVSPGSGKRLDVEVEFEGKVNLLCNVARSDGKPGLRDGTWRDAFCRRFH